MDINDALTVTFLGIGVVFVGLILTSIMIKSFSLLPKLAKLFQKTPEEAPVEVPEPEEKFTVSEPVTPEIMAVITSVLEVELRLRESLADGKFTFR